MQANKNHLITSRSVTFNVMFPCYQKLGQITHSDYNNLYNDTTNHRLRKWWPGGLNCGFSLAEDLVFKITFEIYREHDLNLR